MNRSVGFRLVLALAASTILGAGAAHAQADYKPPSKRIAPGTALALVTKSDLPTPRRADGKPDLTGAWPGLPRSRMPPAQQRHPGTTESDQMVAQRGSGWNKPHYKPELWSKVRELDFSIIDADPAYNCAFTGTPRQGPPNRIVQSDKEVILFYGDNYRVVPVDGRTRNPADLDQETYLGIPLGRWEGDTLVVESVGFNDISWLQFQGYFHTNLMTVTERFWRQGNLLYYNWTVDDPDVLVEPYTYDTMVKVLYTGPPQTNGEPPLCEPTGYPKDNPYSRG